MNTREREVMDLSRHSRAMLLNVLWHHQGGSSAVGQPIRALLGIGEHDQLTDEQVAEAKWIDALLASSAAGEQAEAVAWREIRPDGKPVDAKGCYYPGTGPTGRALEYIYERGGRVEYVYTRPQPAQGEPATVDALAQFIREIDGKHELGASALAEKIVERFSLQQGEHEQRSCDGSELPVLERYGIEWRGPHMPIALPMPDGYWTPWHIAEEALRCASERRPIADEVACSVANVILFGSPNIAASDLPVSLVKLAIESALPRGLPAGSDVTALLIALLRHIDSETCRHEETHRGGSIWTICDQCGREWADDQGGFEPYQDAPAVAAAREYCDRIDAAIAAQQRQGGAKEDRT